MSEKNKCHKCEWHGEILKDLIRLHSAVINGEKFESDLIEIVSDLTDNKQLAKSLGEAI